MKAKLARYRGSILACHIRQNSDMIEIMSDWIYEHLSALPSTERTFGPGEFLFHLGDEVRWMHVILDGAVHLLRRQDNGTSIILQRAQAGSLLAEASLFSDRYHCDATAMERTRTRLIAASAVRSQLETNPDFATAWAAHLAGEVQAARLRAEILSLKHVAARLDAWLAWHGGRLPPKGDWKTVAGEIGTSPEALYREIAKRRRAASGS